MDAAHEFVNTVEGRLGQALAGDGGVLAAASRALCLEGGGKRVRARLTGLLGAAAGTPPRALEDVAAAGELIHAASLLHDDVVDGASLRRGRATANARWGSAQAVLAGDWLLSTAFSLLHAWPRSVTTEAIEVVGEMSRAASGELDARGRLDLSLDDWRGIAEGKTGALFAWGGRSAAVLAGRDELVEPFTGFGRRLGVAFQLADDLKDLVGGDGKDRYSDLKNRNPSMPIVWAVSRDADFRAVLTAAWAREEPLSADEAEALGAVLAGLGAVEANASWLTHEVAAAVACLSPLGNPPWLGEIEALARTFARGLAPEEAA